MPKMFATSVGGWVVSILAFAVVALVIVGAMWQERLKVRNRILLNRELEKRQRDR